MSDHARLSPSSRYRWGVCPASVKACEKYEGKGSSSAASIDGTHSHTLLEHCVKHMKDEAVADPKQFIGMLLQDHEGMFGVDADRADRVCVATDYINNMLKVRPGAQVISEKRVDPAALVGRTDMSGTVDVQIIWNSMIEIIDYKDGMNEVVAQDNPQLEQYAIAALAEHMAAGRTFDTVLMTIIQPKIALKGGIPITTSVVNAEEFFTRRLEKIIKQADAVDDPNAPFVPGEKQCTYCPHRGACAASTTFFLQQSGIKFGDMNVAKDAAQKDPTTLDDKQLRELVEAGPLLRKMVDAAEAEALRRMTGGHAVEGLKVVRGRGSRSWSLSAEETAEKLKKMGMPKDAIWQVSLISPAGVEKVKWEKRDGTVKQLTEKQLKVVESELVAHSDGKLTVVPEADRRQAVPFTDLKEMFKPVVPDAIPAWMA